MVNLRIFGRGMTPATVCRTSARIDPETPKPTFALMFPALDKGMGPKLTPKVLLPMESCFCWKENVSLFILEKATT